MGATVDPVSTHGWSRKFDPGADDEEAAEPDASQRDDSH
jgi:hypothetical protein